MNMKEDMSGYVFAMWYMSIYIQIKEKKTQTVSTKYQNNNWSSVGILK